MDTFTLVVMIGGAVGLYTSAYFSGLRKGRRDRDLKFSGMMMKLYKEGKVQQDALLTVQHVVIQNLGNDRPTIRRK